MTKRLLSSTAVAVLAMALLAQIAATQVPPPLEFDNYEQQRQIDRIVNAPEGCTDLVLAGTSLMGAAGNPEIVASSTQFSVRNVALGGGGPLIMVPWFDEVVEPHLCPTTVVIGLGPRDANDNFVDQEATVTRYLESKGRPHLIGTAGAVQQIDRWLSRNVGFFSLRSAYRRPATALAFALNGSGNWRETSGADGRITAFDDIVYSEDQAREERIALGSMRDFATGGRNFAAVETLISNLQENNVEVILVDMPRVEGAVDRIIGPERIDQYEAAMADLADRSAIPLLQADESLTETQLFADEWHLNSEGSNAFSTWLAENLR